LSRDARYASGSEDSTCSTLDGPNRSADSFPSNSSVPCSPGKPARPVNELLF
jgi:hypothetical protein